MYGKLDSTITVPDDVKVSLSGSTVEVEGNLGKLKRDFSKSGLLFTLDGQVLSIRAVFPKKKEKALLGTVTAHINNMIKGVTEGFKYSMKIVYSHFPIKVNVDQKKKLVTIENLYGGQKPRYAKIMGDTKVEVDGENVYVSGVDKEAVGQTCARIQELTKLRGKRRKSPKTFMDGIFIFDKKGTMVSD